MIDRKQQETTFKNCKGKIITQEVLFRQKERKKVKENTEIRKIQRKKKIPFLAQNRLI